ncbi:helix-turn-helix transcriptional regulator [Dyella sp.]|jgi:DNA-binding transcriptional ArsR family regulator|uniref:ArsR/SmtB family transcription factor n=1 Tax=Dyella sp. TaxID=1869338 RepID=UPI002D781CAA|nr:helix-turn-helix transcriptional regulator [Dyella sp.]HET6432513.1 helix-turn-helix transcriptional regulator [Dyella sp.]
MSPAPDIAALAAVLADRRRAAMVSALMDGRALTATELAAVGEVAASTASSHLARLVAAGLLEALPQGRHRYFRLRGAGVAGLLEGLMAHAAPPPTVPTGPVDGTLRLARVCYDHLAGSCGTALFDALCAAGCLERIDEAVRLTADGEAWCLRQGIDVPALRRQRRPLCRSCLDWSERRPHLAGALGAALLQRLLEQGVLQRQAAGRALGVGARWNRLLETLAVPA